MRDSRRCWDRAGAKCETLAFGIVQPRNARRSSFLESCRREMQDARCFWNRAGAKCEESLRREMRDTRRFWSRAGTKREILLGFAWIGRDPRNSCGFGFSIRKHYSHTFEKKRFATPLTKEAPPPASIPRGLQPSVKGPPEALESLPSPLGQPLSKAKDARDAWRGPRRAEGHPAGHPGPGEAPYASMHVMYAFVNMYACVFM